MNKEKIKNDIILPRLRQDEELIGFFQGEDCKFNLLVLLLSLLAEGMSIPVRTYYVAVTDQGLHLHKLRFLSTRKVTAYNFFSYAEISKMNLVEEFISTDSLKLVFSTGRELKLETLSATKQEMQLDNRTRNFLLSKSS